METISVIFNYVFYILTVNHKICTLGFKKILDYYMKSRYEKFSISRLNFWKATFLKGH
ncbi:hypothetical protein SASK131_20170 [Staphylococcus argenteus]|nr:hypothetical protein TMSFP064_18570 [Staphylococcus argenteus]BCN91483.1 hypothetical protein TMSFP069_18580 [Staphylococcus argenteus]GJF39792.1 hypothetical protein SA19056_19990 [Staphylococcus argenteus]GJF42460.1 hypothetical protein SA19059_21120 [Staphylococcus argenteus]GJF47522.1 hypothetical protein SA19080_20380 [Staphylococcus argenteus]